MVYAARSAEDARAELRGLAPMREFGYDLPDDVITGAELHELEPALSAEVTAGFLVRQHWHVKPDTITAGLAAALRRDGVDIQEGAEVFELVRQENRLTHVRTAAGDLEADTVVLAAGAWTTPLAHSHRRLHPDGGRQGLQLLDPTHGHAVARDPALGRARGRDAVR